MLQLVVLDCNHCKSDKDAWCDRYLRLSWYAICRSMYSAADELGLGSGQTSWQHLTQLLFTSFSSLGAWHSRQATLDVIAIKAFSIRTWSSLFHMCVLLLILMLYYFQNGFAPLVFVFYVFRPRPGPERFGYRGFYCMSYTVGSLFSLDTVDGGAAGIPPSENLLI